MASPIPKRPDERRRRNKPSAGEWAHAEGTGWQHGRKPRCPAGLTDASKDAWAIWFGSWVAAHWSEHDLPALRLLVKLYDEVERGEFVRAGELRLWLDSYGLTPKGSVARRWLPPKDVVPKARKSKGTAYGHLVALRE